jgi:hypothetical protein
MPVLWRRLDVPGHDACRLAARDDGWDLAGTAVFLHGGVPALLAYSLRCDRRWFTTGGRVQGFVGASTVDITIERRSGGTWLVNGAPVPGLDACAHLDFGFTPATNLPQLQQLALAEGQGAELLVAWLDVPPAPLVRLPQRYERRSASSYWYESPDHGYAALLELAADGFVRRYPGLWEMEP